MSAESNDGRSDAALLRATADGDRAAFAVLYARHAPWLLARLRYRCSDASLVEEVVQDTFLNVWRSADRVQGAYGGDLTGWLWTVAMRRLVDAFRHGSVRDRVMQRLRAGFRTEVAGSAEEQVLVGVEHGDLAGALLRLSPELRAALQATVLDGLTNREAAVLLGIPAGTVKTRVARARARLREELT